jgi:hypothetical protein
MLPVLAGRPLGAAPVSVFVLCVVAIALAGGVTGWRLARRPGTHLLTGLRQVAVAGAAAGLLTAVLTALAGGPAGPGALSAVGASPWQVGLSVAGELMLPAAVVVLTALAGGPAGPGALSAVGASPWQVGLSVAGELMLPAAVVVLTWIWLVRLPAVAALPGCGRQLLARLKR